MAVAVCDQCRGHWLWRALRGARLANVRCPDCQGKLRAVRRSGAKPDPHRPAWPRYLRSLQGRIAQSRRMVAYYQSIGPGLSGWRLRELGKYAAELARLERLRGNETISPLGPDQQEPTNDD